MEVSIRRKAVDHKFSGKYEFEEEKIYPEPGSYLEGNPLAPVAVAIPFPDKEAMQTSIEAGAAIAGFVVTANIGLEKLIVNLVANPNLRYLILWGKESKGHLSADALLKCWKNGISKEGRIKGAKGATPFLKNIPTEAVKRFRKQIKIINLLELVDLSVLKKAIHGCIQEPSKALELILKEKKKKWLLYDPGRFKAKPLRCKITEKLHSEGIYETLSSRSTSIQAPTITAAYPLLLEAIGSAGLKQSLPDERGSYTKELLNVSIHLSKPLEDMIPPCYRPESWLKSKEVKSYLKEYFKTYLKPNLIVTRQKGKIKAVPAEMEYTYGYFIQKHHGIKQYEKCIKEIKSAVKAKEHSRRILMLLPDPKTLRRKKENPCFIDYQLFPRYENKWKLHASAHMRSHDAAKAFPANCYAFAKLLEKISKKVGIEPGSLTIFYGSCHLYLD